MSDDVQSPRREQPASLSRTSLGIGLFLGVGLTAALIVAGIMPRLESKKQRDESRQVLAESQPEVAIVHSRPEKAEQILSLPASLEAFQEVKINARVDGYVESWAVDIGDHVRTGQALAHIQAPELLQRRAEAAAAVAEARADVAQAQSEVRRISSEWARLTAEEEQALAEVGQNQADIRARQSDSEFARVSNDRWQKLVSDQAISLQEADQRASSYLAAQANVQAAQGKLLAARSRVKAARARKVALRAEVETGQARVHSAESKVEARLAAVNRVDSELAFCTVSAPFSGVITQRRIDIGSLVSAGGDKTTLFELSQSRRLRAFIDVPESAAPAIRVGQRAHIKLSQFAGKNFSATVTRTSGSLDKSTRTLKTQLELTNPGMLEPGMHCSVELSVVRPSSAVVLPSTAVSVKPEGPKVLVLDDQQRVHWRNITLGADYGKEVQIIQGLSVADRVVDFPADGLQENEAVRPVEAKSK